MSLTKSEKLFEAFCKQINLCFQRVPESSGQRPDYEIFPKESRVIVEIKQLDPNEEERAAALRKTQGEIVVLGSTPGERIRRAVRSANPQLKSLSDGIVSSLVIIYNNTDCTLHTRPMAVMTAMQGIDTVKVTVPSNPSESPIFGSTVSGPERGMQQDRNTTVSAICILRGDQPENYRLDVYHNRFARNPLDSELFHLPGIRQYEIPQDATNSLTNWEEI